MSSAHYISDTDGSDKIYFDIDPYTVPAPQNSRTVGTLKCLRGSSAAGSRRKVDSGGGSGSKSITVNVKYAEVATVALIQAKYDTVAELIYYDADNAKTYTCAWDGDNSFLVTEIEGILQREITLKLSVISEA